MTEHPNAVAVRQGFEAYNSGRLDVLGEYSTDDVILHFAGNNVMSGTYRGRDAVIDALARARRGGGLLLHRVSKRAPRMIGRASDLARSEGLEPPTF